jgi:hypothetical protein
MTMDGPAHSVVMRGLDPRIHPLRKNPFERWIAGSSPAMTKFESDEAA